MTAGKSVKFGSKTYVNSDDYPASLATSADTFTVVTLSDSADLPGGCCRAFWAGAAGAVAAVDRYGNAVTIQAIAGWNPFILARIKSTGTTATGLLAIH